MKKIFAIILALCLVAALFVGCAGTNTNEPSTPTKAPDATEAPAEEATPTEAPADDPTPTAEPTSTPEPTPEPFTDPYAQEILDWSDADGQNASFDTIAINGELLMETDGKVVAWKDENDETVDGTAGNVSSIGMRGWAGFFDYDMIAYGYQIDENPVVFVEGATIATEAAVKGAGGEHAQRFWINIPVGNLTGDGHEIKIVVKLEDGTLAYLNNELANYVLYYNGPEAAGEASVVDGTIGAAEYTASYALKAANAQTWTSHEMGDRVINYYLSLKEDGVYVGIDATGAVSGDMLQINFNPGARIDESTGLFVSFVVGDALKVLLHNHTNSIGEGTAAGVDITDKIEAKIVAKEGGYVVEAKLPADFFKVTDVEKADQFVFGKENLYFGMFVVLNGAEGFTNQSAAPGTDWTCKGLGLHEYIVY